MKRPGHEDMLESLAAEFGRSRVNEVRESSGRLPPNAKYWLPRDGIVAVSALMFLFVCVCVCVCESQSIEDENTITTLLLTY